MRSDRRALAREFCHFWGVARRELGVRGWIRLAWTLGVVAEREDARRRRRDLPVRGTPRDVTIIRRRYARDHAGRHR